MRFGIRLHVIARDTSEAAWAEAERLLARLDPDTVARVQANLRRSASDGQRRMLDLARGAQQCAGGMQDGEQHHGRQHGAFCARRRSDTRLRCPR